MWNWHRGSLHAADSSLDVRAELALFSVMPNEVKRCRGVSAKRLFFGSARDTSAATTGSIGFRLG
jgi:hypothetical protein